MIRVFNIETPQDPDFKEKDIMEALLYLHMTGEVLHFVGTPGLKHYVFVSPIWLIDVIKCVINPYWENSFVSILKNHVSFLRTDSEDAFKDHGQVSQNILRKLWENFDLDSDQFKLLQTLATSFGLWYPEMEGTEKYYIIPTLMTPTHYDMVIEQVDIIQDIQPNHYSQVTLVDFIRNFIRNLINSSIAIFVIKIIVSFTINLITNFTTNVIIKFFNILINKFINQFIANCTIQIIINCTLNVIFDFLIMIHFIISLTTTLIINLLSNLTINSLNAQTNSPLPNYHLQVEFCSLPPTEYQIVMKFVFPYGLPIGLFSRAAVKCRRHVAQYTFHSNHCFAGTHMGVSTVCVATENDAGKELLF